MKRWLIWAFVLVGWTVLLLVPLPPITFFRDTGDLKYWLAKGLHVAAYAILTVLSGWMEVPLRYRWFLLFLVMAHGTATEILQGYIPRRTGTLTDLSYDNLGVFLGLLVSWKWWSKP